MFMENPSVAKQTASYFSTLSNKKQASTFQSLCLEDPLSAVYVCEVIWFALFVFSYATEVRV